MNLEDIPDNFEDDLDDCFEKDRDEIESLIQNKRNMQYRLENDKDFREKYIEIQSNLLNCNKTGEEYKEKGDEYEEAERLVQNLYRHIYKPNNEEYTEEENVETIEDLERLLEDQEYKNPVIVIHNHSNITINLKM